MKSIAQIIHQQNFPLVIRDSNGNSLYIEITNMLWVVRLFDSNGTEIAVKHSSGYIWDDR